MEFSEKLKSLRTEKGISQQALADAIYVSRSAVAKWENGFGLPCDESLNLLCEYFGVEKGYLVRENENENVQKNRTISKYKRLIITLGSVAAAFLILITVGLSLFLSDAYSSGIKALPYPENFPCIIVENVRADSCQILNPPPSENPRLVAGAPIKEDAKKLPLLPYQEVYKITLPQNGSLNSVRYYYLNDDYTPVQEDELSASPMRFVSPAQLWWTITRFEAAVLFPEKDEVKVFYLQNDHPVIILEFNYEYNGYKAVSYFRVLK